MSTTTTNPKGTDMDNVDYEAIERIYEEAVRKADEAPVPPSWQKLAKLPVERLTQVAEGVTLCQADLYADGLARWAAKDYERAVRNIELAGFATVKGQYLHERLELMGAVA